MQPDSPDPQRLRIRVKGVLWAFTALLAFMLLNPSALIPSSLVWGTADLLVEMGVPLTFAAAPRLEFLLNILGVVPVVFLAAWLWPTRPWHQWMSWGFMASLGVEIIQAVALTGRSAAFDDIVANTLGALVGAAGFTWLAEALPPLDRRPAAPSDQSP